MVTVVFALLQGPAEGAVVGFVGGLAQDFMLNMPKGITALTLTILGYTVGLARQYIASPSPLLPAFLVFIGTAAGVAFHQAVAFLLGEHEGPFSYVVKVVLAHGPLRCRAHADLLPDPPPCGGRVPRRKGGALLDGAFGFEAEDPRVRRRVHVRGALDASVVPAGPRRAATRPRRARQLAPNGRDRRAPRRHRRPRGRRLVHNRISLEVRIKRDELGDEAEATLAHLSEILGIPAQDARRGARHEALLQLPARSRSPSSSRSRSTSRSGRSRRSSKASRSSSRASAAIRRDPLAAHLVGWVGQINAEEIDDPRFARYGPSDLVGKAGIEATYERWLRGQARGGAVPRQLGRRGPPRVRSEAGRAWARPAALARPRRPTDRRGGARRRDPARADRLRPEQRTRTWRRTREPWWCSIRTRAGSWPWRRGPPSARPGS